MKSIINWFEIPVTDMERAIAFYEPVMGLSLRREKWTSPIWRFSRMTNRLPAVRWRSLTASHLQCRGDYLSAYRGS